MLPVADCDLPASSTCLPAGDCGDRGSAAVRSLRFPERLATGSRLDGMRGGQIG
jgi:hypothetical protein